MTPPIRMVSVPVEPTEAMMNACPSSFSPSFAAIWPKVCRDIYQAMLIAAPVSEEGGAVDASAILEMAAKAVEDHQKQGREWVKGSLWDDLTREASGRIRALKSQLASRKEAPPQAPSSAFMARAKHLLDLAEEAEDKALDGDEGCVWPVEALRVAYAELTAQPPAREGEGE